jgi:hypothetical protein
MGRGARLGELVERMGLDLMRYSTVYLRGWRSLSWLMWMGCLFKVVFYVRRSRSLFSSALSQGHGEGSTARRLFLSQENAQYIISRHSLICIYL